MPSGPGFASTWRPPGVRGIRNLRRNHQLTSNSTSLKQLARKLTPRPMWRLGSDAYWWWYNRGSHRLAAALSPQLARTRRILRGYANRHRGERCFILGNGPSLNHTDLSRLKGELTFGTNRIYLLFDDLGFATTYYAAINTLVIEQCADDIQAMSIPRFVTWRARRWLADRDEVLFLDTDYTGRPTFAEDLAGRIFEGGTVTYVAMQLAYAMGFREVILVGVDHSYFTKGPPNAAVESTGPDPNHFHLGYFGKGFRWQLPDLEASERSYRMAREAFERDGRRIVDATIGGKLTIFPKVDYEALFRA